MTLRQMRENSGLTRMQVGTRLNITESCIAHWELGDSTPTGKYHAKLAKMYGVSIKELREASSADVAARRNYKHMRELMRAEKRDTVSE